VDAKLARSAKARAVLQTAFYSHLLADVQGIAPRWMHLALGDGELTSFKVDDFAAYERQTRRLLEAAIGGDPAAEVYPEPVEHCAICRWRDVCRQRRRADDDLSLVAGMPTGQRRALKDDGISTRRGFALCGYDRRVDLAEATASLIALEAALEEGTAARDGERRRVVAGYNEDDCRATLALRDWLEGRRAELAERLGEELPRPVFAEKPGAAEDPETARIRSALLVGVSAETTQG
jgi:predicted RecB family nuclease